MKTQLRPEQQSIAPSIGGQASPLPEHIGVGNTNGDGGGGDGGGEEGSLGIIGDGEEVTGAGELGGEGEGRVLGEEGGVTVTLLTIHLCSPDPSSRTTNLRVKSLHVLEALKKRAHPMRRSLAMMLTCPGLPPQDFGTGLTANRSVPVREGEADKVTPESWQAGRLSTTRDPWHSMGPVGDG